jgi:hypothetical protein
VARGAVRGALTAWLGLITLQVVTSQHGSGQVAGAFEALNSVVKRALSADVAAIPDYRNGSPAASAVGSTKPAAAAAPAAYTTVGGSIPVPSGSAGTTIRKI